MTKADPRHRLRDDVRCLVCDGKPRWVRCTQFSGDHPFCDACARRQANFGHADSSYFFWVQVDDEGYDIVPKPKPPPVPWNVFTFTDTGTSGRLP